MPCSQLSFYDGLAMVPFGGELSCENPSVPESGGANCCSLESLEGDGDSFEHFTGERLSYDTAQKRCRENSMDVCLSEETSRS